MRRDNIVVLLLCTLVCFLIWVLIYEVHGLWHIHRHGCPFCRQRMVRIIYFGLPGRLCPNPTCSCLAGPAAWIAKWWFTGQLFVYQGSYFRGLWHYLRGSRQ